MPTRPGSDTHAGGGLLADAFRQAVTTTIDQPDPPPNVVFDLLSEHFGGVDPQTLPTLTDNFPPHLHVVFQLALDDFLAEDGRTHEVVGAFCPSAPDQWHEVGANSLALLLAPPTLAWAPTILTPADYQMRPVASDKTKACLLQGLVLFRDADGPGAIWVRGVLGNRLMVDVMHPSQQRGQAILADLRARGVALSPYRGQVIEISRDHVGSPVISFVRRPKHTEADQVILPQGLLEEIEEHTTDILAARPVLEATGRHMKRGILLHGRPGTGKTHTIRYLISQLPGATVAVMAAGRTDLSMVPFVIDVIVPGVIILDDVDFIAEDRSLPGLSVDREALFHLLEVLDGIGDDADLLFVLTTNRPNTLEPAVAARPGRIDQAVEVPLPDADCRRRLLELYARDLTLDASDHQIADFIARTEGVTASFVREALRRAAVVSLIAEGFSAEGPITVTGQQLLDALDQMLDPANPLTPVLLGAEPEHAQPTLATIIAPLAAPVEEPAANDGGDL